MSNRETQFPSKLLEMHSFHMYSARMMIYFTLLNKKGRLHHVLGQRLLRAGKLTCWKWCFLWNSGKTQRPSLELTSPNPPFTPLLLLLWKLSELDTQKIFTRVKYWGVSQWRNLQTTLVIVINNSCVAAYFANMGSLSQIYQPLPFIPRCFVTTDVEYSDIILRRQHGSDLWSKHMILHSLSQPWADPVGEGKPAKRGKLWQWRRWCKKVDLFQEW